MIIIPLSTDAPIYHWPWMTLVLIVVNCVVFVITGYGENPEGWILQFGRGLHPVEWLANNFLHFGWIHLIGNMVFLWGFGIIVEGKLGWWRYLLLYLLLGALGGLIVQTAMLGRDPNVVEGSGGASLCIFGLLAICMVWAPKNEMTCWMLLLYRGISFDISLLALGVWFIAEQVLWALWSGFAMSSEMLHLTGAVLGFGAGVALLKLGWVDCEHWDLFAVWSGRYGHLAERDDWENRITVTHSPNLRDGGGEATKLKKKKRFRPSIYLSSQPKRRKPSVKASASFSEENAEADVPAAKRSMSESSLPAATLKVLDRMRELIRAGKPQAALGEYRKRLRIVDHWPLEADDLQALADGLFKFKLWDEAAPLLEEFVARFPAAADGARIKLAAICCEIQNRPRAALKLLDQVELDDFPDSVRSHIAQIRGKAERLLDDDHFELDGKSW